MSNFFIDGMSTLKNTFSKAVKNIGRNVKTALLDNINITSKNLRDFKVAFFNFKAASILQQTASILRIGAGLAMIATGLSIGDPILSMSGPFVAMSGFDKMRKYGEDYMERAHPANAFTEAAGEGNFTPGKERGVMRSALHAPAVHVPSMI